MRYVLGLFLLGHALIHFSYLAPAPPQTAGGPEWPFAMSKSWLAANLSSIGSNFTFIPGISAVGV